MILIENWTPKALWNHAWHKEGCIWDAPKSQIVNSLVKMDSSVLLCIWFVKEIRHYSWWDIDMLLLFHQKSLSMLISFNSWMLFGYMEWPDIAWTKTFQLFHLFWVYVSCKSIAYIGFSNFFWILKWPIQLDWLTSGNFPFQDVGFRAFQWKFFYIPPLISIHFINFLLSKQVLE